MLAVPERAYRFKLQTLCSARSMICVAIISAQLYVLGNAGEFSGVLYNFRLLVASKNGDAPRPPVKITQMLLGNLAYRYSGLF